MKKRLLFDRTYEVDVLITPEDLDEFYEREVDDYVTDALYDAGAEVQEVGEYTDDGEGTLQTTIMFTVLPRDGVDSARLDRVIADVYADRGCPVDEVGEYRSLSAETEVDD